MKVIDKILSEIEDAVTTGIYKCIEDESIELKDNSHTGGQWDKLMETVCAFLNSGDGKIIIGIKEEVNKGYLIKGFDFDQEPKIKEICNKQFINDNGQIADVGNYITFVQKELAGFQLLVIYVDALPADEKYVFYKGSAYERRITGDHKISERRIESNKESKQEIREARELRPVANAVLQDLDIDKLNYYIQLLNAEIKVQSFLPTINDAIPFLTRRGMLHDKVPTILGMLVCGSSPADFLHWRSQVDAYVDLPGSMPINKKILNDNVLPLLEQSQAFVFRNIQTGISIEKGGTKTFEYPEELIRECINNSLAHRDYSIDQFVNINIIPGKHIQIKNPGRFKSKLLINTRFDNIDIKRIIPNPTANNPKLATVLGVYNKWEGKGRGMKNLVSAALDGHIDLPYFQFHSADELSLFIPKGQLVDERMETVFESYSKHIFDRLDGDELTMEQKMVFAYFYKSEVQNRNNLYTLLLTQDNNHLVAINFLAEKGLIKKYVCEDGINEVFIVERLFYRDHFYKELRAVFGSLFDQLSTEYKQVLNAVFLFKNNSLKNNISANQIGNYLYYKQNQVFDLQQYDAFKRKVRYQFNELEKRGLLKATKVESKSGNLRNVDYELVAEKGLWG